MNEELKISYKKQDITISIKQTSGPDETVVFLHGLGCSKESFNQAFMSESMSNYSIVTFDFVGFGDSDKPADFSYSLADQAEVTKRVLNTLNLGGKPIHIVAHSMGGVVGLLLSRMINNIASFMSVEGNLVAEDAGIISRDIASQNPESFLNEGFKKAHESLALSKTESDNEWSRWFMGSDPVATYLSARSLVQWSDSGKLMPWFNSLYNKGFLHGSKTGIDHLTPLFEAVKIYEVSDAGHFMMLDSPVRFYELVSHHISKSK